VEVKVKKSTEQFSVDEHPRPKTTMETLGKLPSVFKKDGTVTAGNASGICDGAAANVVASDEAIKRYGLKPLARIVSYGVTACEPSIMGVSNLSFFLRGLIAPDLTKSLAKMIHFDTDAPLIGPAYRSDPSRPSSWHSSVLP
jgi:Thiolase, N-terminal domain